MHRLPEYLDITENVTEALISHKHLIQPKELYFRGRSDLILKICSGSELRGE